MHGIAMRAQPLILRLKVETAVKIERRAIFVELGPDARVIGKDEIDLLGPRQQCALDGRRRDALRALLFHPLEFREQRARLDRDAKDHLVLNDQPSDGLAYGRGLRGEQAEQERHEIQYCSRSHLAPIPMTRGFAANR